MTEQTRKAKTENTKEQAFFAVGKIKTAGKAVVLLCAFLCAVMTACGTLPTNENIPPNLTPTELKQRAQEQFDKGNNRKALAYYEILLIRYGSDISVKTAAEFEIAHILIKQKKWAKADEMLEAIIARYESAGGAGITPKYYVLAKNDYAQTQAQLQKRNFSKKNEDTGTEPVLKQEKQAAPLPAAEALPSSEQTSEPKKKDEPAAEQPQ